MTDLYVVAGHPIAHSRSPRIHTLFAEQAGQDLEYHRLLIPLGCFADEARAFFAAGGKGMNVTLPFKTDAFHLASVLSERARHAGAVNTLSIAASGDLCGDNTDGVGLLRDIRDNLGWTIAGHKILLLGAGGAVRGVLAPLLEANPATVVIANRTARTAEELAAKFAHRGSVTAREFSQLHEPFDIVINGTSASLDGAVADLPDDCITSDSRCYDMAYAAAPTAFLDWAARRGASACVDGIGMLVEQAAESFFVWRGLKPRTPDVIAVLRSELHAEAITASAPE